MDDDQVDPIIPEEVVDDELDADGMPKKPVVDDPDEEDGRESDEEEEDDFI